MASYYDLDAILTDSQVISRLSVAELIVLIRTEESPLHLRH